MKEFKNPIEVRVQLVELGPDVVRASVECPFHFVPVDQRRFALDVITALIGHSLPSLHGLYDGALLLCGNMDFPFPSVDVVPSESRSLSIAPRSYELSDGVLHDVSFALELCSPDVRRDYVISGVRCIRLLGFVTVECESDGQDEEKES